MYDLFNQQPYTPKQEAIQSSYDNAGEDFQEKAEAFLIEYAADGKEFIAEDVRLASVGEVPEPREARSWGGVFVKAVKKGIIKWTGKYGEMKSKHSHSCPKKIWVKA